METSTICKYPLFVSNHARERWLERIVSPNRYSHLRFCTGCGTCRSLIEEMRLILIRARRGIDKEICSRYRKARELGNEINNEIFKKAKIELYPGENLEFYFESNVVFVVVYKLKDKGQIDPVLATVLSSEMIEATYLKLANTKEELKRIFSKPKFGSRRI